MYANLKDDDPESKITFTHKHDDCDAYKSGHWDFLGIFLKSKLIKIIFFLILPLVFLNFWLFRYDDFEEGCHVVIYPSITEVNNLKIKEGISLLKDKSPSDYKRFCALVDGVSPEIACGGMGAGCYNENRPSEISVSTIFRPLKNHTETTAAIIVHETCVLFQNRRNRPLDDAECYKDYCRVLGAMGVKKNSDIRCSGANNDLLGLIR